MANTTFSGPVRSENNVQLISKTASTTLAGPVVMNPFLDVTGP